MFFQDLWGLAKNEVRKRMMERQNQDELDFDEFEDIVLGSCYDVARQHWRNLINVNESYISRCIAGEHI